MPKIGIIVTPYRECLALEKERKKMEIDDIKITQHGTITGIIVNDKIMLTTIIADASGAVVSADLLLDTGSNLTVVHPRIVQSFQKSDGVLIIGSHMSGDSQTVTAKIQIENILTIEDHEISVMALNAFEDTGIDGVIGMDIIQAGELHIYRKEDSPYYEFTL